MSKHNHPRKQERRIRAQERAAAHVCGPTCRRYRLGKAKWPPKRVQVIDEVIRQGEGFKAVRSHYEQAVMVAEPIARAPLDESDGPFTMGHYSGFGSGRDLIAKAPSPHDFRPSKRIPRGQA